MLSSERIFTVVGAVVALLLQLLVAPYIAIGSGMPNFAVVFATVYAVLRSESYGSLLPFALGLVFDLFSGGPVGGMAFCLTLFTYLLARYCAHVGNDSPLMSIAFIALGLLLVEVSYGVFLSLFGYSANIVEALAYRIAPCFVYNLVIALIFFPIARRFVQPPVATRTDITQLR